MNIINDFFGNCKNTIINTINKLKGYDRRIALAELATEYGYGGQSMVAKEFNAGRDTIRTGIQELRTGIKFDDAYHLRGRHKTEDKLPNLTDDIRQIAESQSQTDPKFQSTRLYTRLTVAEFRRQLVKEKGYVDTDLPTNQTLTTIINKLGYQTQKVQKTKPIKKIPETDAIFENLHKVHKEIQNNYKTVRLSIDAKDRVKIGCFSRGGKSRVLKTALDHDFGNEYMTPFGIMDVKLQKVDIVMTKSKVTADFIADQLEKYWVENNFAEGKDTLVINSDNGPESNSKRTQFIKRMVEFSIKYNVKLILAYYPPYHSKYNPVERVWGALEQHWNGDVLDSEEAVLEFAKTMTWNGENPNVTIDSHTYDIGKKINKKAMDMYESVITRMKGIEKWFVSIDPQNCKKLATVQFIT